MSLYSLIHSIVIFSSLSTQLSAAYWSKAQKLHGLLEDGNHMKAMV